ncbi:aldehyde dehydrogenase family protein [Bordetella sp. N]|uniref:aldehyde dehydrogenase family protein n=1 Tax=Bordetella sp. N TaxID=1746199 RepID=UPI00070BF8D6|nr:aldehyde dehydrogenase family protein [Bordetella sp. N]ALM84232.1 aldehyde dehydrogenase [Bordetella sp. N]
MKSYEKFFVGGQWIDPFGSGFFQLVNPATEETFARVRLGNAEDVDRAVRAARLALPGFSATSKDQRIAMLERIVAAFIERQDDLMAAITEEIGAPASLKGQTGSALQALQQAIKTLKDYDFESNLEGNVVLREPIGVCGIITAWNWPLQLLCTKIGSAFAAGCTLVVKPSEYTPIDTLILAEVLEAADVPPGVFNVVIGDGPTVGDALARHPGVDMISFTGSTRAGIQVAQAAAVTVKRVCQELGGKSANIILQDADLRAAARYNVTRGCSNSGQSCHSPTRMLVHESQAAEFERYLVEEAAAIKVGDPLQANTTMGPVINRAQFERVQGYIETGIAEGARVLVGGPGRPEGIQRGYYIQPTIFADVKPGMRIEQEEIFGPVMALLTYRTVDEAVEIANGTSYGLGGYIFAKDRSSARLVAERMKAGRIFLNGAPSNNVAPMGGYKQSGNGREMGVFGLEEYLEVKALLGFEDD